MQRVLPKWHWLQRWLSADVELRSGYLFSAFLHLALFLFLAIGGIVFWDVKPFQEQVVSVEILPISTQTNVQKHVVPTPKRKREVKRYTKSISRPKPKAVVKPKRTRPTPALKKKIVSPAAKLKVKSSPKKAQLKPKLRKLEKQKTSPDMFDSLLKSLEQASSKEEQKQKRRGANMERHQQSLPLSLSEIDAIRSQIIQCWTLPVGARHVGDMSLALYIRLNQDGALMQSAVSRESVYRSEDEGYFRAFAESALRAVEMCSPLQGLPNEKYDQWKEMEFYFDPKDMVG